MASFFNLTLDTLAPVGLRMTVNGNAVYATSKEVTLQIAVNDTDTTGYQMKIWGIEGSVAEKDSRWQTFTSTKNVNLPGVDGLKTVYIKVRDNVGNETTAASDSITLDTVVPTVTISGPDKNKISKVTGYNVAIINFMANVAFKTYKVCVVPASNSTQTSGVTIGKENGSRNTSGVKGGGSDLYPANTNIEVAINGADLEAASAGDGVKIIKVFVQNDAGTWSVA